jgi:hypothetical protein
MCEPRGIEYVHDPELKAPTFSVLGAAAFGKIQMLLL